MQVQNGFSSLKMKKNTYFCTRCPLCNSLIIYIPKNPYSNDVNFNICQQTNTNRKTRCKFDKIALRMGYLGHFYYYIKSLKI